MPGYYTWSNNSITQSRTIIDHVLHTQLPLNTSLHQGGTVHDDITATLSDHLPVWLTLHLHEPLSFPAPPKPLPIKPHPDLHLGNDEAAGKVRDQFNAHLSQRLSSSLSTKFCKYADNPSHKMSHQMNAGGLAAMALHTVSSVHDKQQGLGKGKGITIQRKCDRIRSNYKNGYSPHMRQLQTYLYFYINMLRLAFPAPCPGRKQHWRRDTYSDLLYRWIRDWKKKYHKIIQHIDDFSPAKQKDGSPEPPHSQVLRLYLQSPRPKQDSRHQEGTPRHSPHGHATVHLTRNPTQK
jgi:hypothetical protein